MDPPALRRPGGITYEQVHFASTRGGGLKPWRVGGELSRKSLPDR